MRMYNKRSNAKRAALKQIGGAEGVDFTITEVGGGFGFAPIADIPIGAKRDDVTSEPDVDTTTGDSEAKPKKNLGKTTTGRASGTGKGNVESVAKTTTKKAKKIEALCPVAFGFSEGTNASQFGAMVAQDGGTTMTDVINAEWNTAGRGYYMTAKALAERGLVKIDRKARPTRFTATKKALQEAKA